MQEDGGLVVFEAEGQLAADGGFGGLGTGLSAGVWCVVCQWKEVLNLP